jgi:nicotinamidase-related amidase
MAHQQLPSNTALLIVDVQQGFDHPTHWGERNNPAAETNIAALLDKWRQTGRPVYHVQHHSTHPDSPLHPDNPGVAFKQEVAPLPNEPIVIKHVNSAFIGTDLTAQLRSAQIGTLVVVGLTTQHCVSTTVRMAGNMGFTVYVAGDATAAHNQNTFDGQTITAETVWQVALASLHNEFATVMTTAQILADT